MNSSKNPFGVIPLPEQPLNYRVAMQKTKIASDVEETKTQDSTKPQADYNLDQVRKPDTAPRACACCCHIAFASPTLPNNHSAPDRNPWRYWGGTL